MVPRGAGTGLGWGAPASACDLVVDLQAMDQVLEHAAGDLVARVQAGVTIGQLASVLAWQASELALDAPRGRRPWAGWSPPARPGRAGSATAPRATC